MDACMGAAARGQQQWRNHHSEGPASALLKWVHPVGDWRWWRRYAARAPMLLPRPRSIAMLGCSASSPLARLLVRRRQTLMRKEGTGIRVWPQGQQMLIGAQPPSGGPGVARNVAECC